MDNQLLEMLACPHCHGALCLTRHEAKGHCIVKGHLTCQACHANFPIEDDIPYFSPARSHRGIQSQRHTYSAWWDAYHDESSIVDPQWRQFFFNSLRMPASSFEGAMVLDAGCGNGRFSYVVSHYRPKRLVCFDISSGLLHAQRAISTHNPGAPVAYVQGDITKPPFRSGVFDIVFSWGVMHHTPHTRKTFSAISRLVRDEGTFGLYLYEFHPRYRADRQSLSLIAYLRSLLLIRPLRWICSRLPIPVVQMIFLPIYLIERMLRVGVVGCHGSGRDRWNYARYRSVVVDRFKTRYASEHQQEEIIGWFHEEGYDALVAGVTPKVSLRGVKRSLVGQTKTTVTFYHQQEVDLFAEQYFSAVTRSTSTG